MANQEAWQLSDNAAENYEQHFVPAIFADWAPRTAGAAEVSSGDRVLDIACGTGVVTRHCADLAGAAGTVIGLDLNDAMLAVARRVRPEIEWRQGDAADLPFDNDAFHAVTCQFGLMFMPDRPKALSEMWRVLAPGGRLAVAVFGSTDDNPPYRILADIGERHAGMQAAAALRSPFVLGDTDELAGVFAKAGIPGAKISAHTGIEHFSSMAWFMEIEIKGTPAAEFVSEDAYRAMVADAEKELAFCQQANGRLEFENRAYIVSARKP